MAHSKYTMSAAALFAAVIIAPATSFAASLPTTINLVDSGDTVTIHQVRQQLRAGGFTDLGTIARDGGIFELVAVWEGEPVSLKINARTRTIRRIVAAAPADSNRLPTHLTMARDAHEVTIPQFVTGLRGLGFSDVSDIRRSGRIFLATANWQGDPTDLRFDAASGAITDRSVTNTKPAGDFPHTILIARDPHQTSIQDMRRGLATLGFKQIANVEKDGRIFTLTADWQGEALDLRVDAASRRITRQ